MLRTGILLIKTVFEKRYAATRKKIGVILHLYLPITASSLQWPLSFVPKVAAVERLKGHCHALWQLYKKQDGVFASIELQTNGLVLL